MFILCFFLKPDFLLSTEVVLCKKGRDLVENNSFKCFRDEWKNEYRSVILQMCCIYSGFLMEWGYPSLLKSCRKE